LLRICCASAGSTVRFAAVKEPDPLVSTFCPAVMPLFTTTLPFTPDAAWWMCARLIGVPAGKPVRFTTNVAVAAVTLFAESRVTTIVTVALPLPEASAPVMTGTSFAGESAAVNVGLVGVEVVGLEFLLHPAARKQTAAQTRENRFITSLLVERQKNFRARLNPNCRLCGNPPVASWPKVVPGVLAKTSEKT
jgi:hypothetical protein